MNTRADLANDNIDKNPNKQDEKKLGRNEKNKLNNDRNRFNDCNNRPQWPPKDNKSKEESGDFINIRLCAYEKEYCNDGYLSPAYYILKQVDDEEMSCWSELSSLVRSKKAVGFPLLKATKRISHGSMLYFEQFKNSKIIKLTPQVKCLNDTVIFQTVVILYSMYKRGIYSNEFCFDLVSIPRTTIVFSVNQLIFNICTDVLVVLSICGNRLYRTNLPQSCYLDFIHVHETIANRGYEHTNYFFEWLIKNHLSLLTKQTLDILKVKKKYASGGTVNRLLEPGTLVYVPKEDFYFVGISLTDVSISDNVRVLFSTDGSVLEIEDFNIKNLFMAGEMFVRTQANTIII
ncbi:internal virion protein [Raccoonpox virus]|uniref:Protein OPG097 n=1 Tax=Raccoon poxvirus TaxID=10256 RepID=A0A0G3G022_RACVI|nr:Internal Virion Protein [Raccoonpox virus]AKJ93719.1 Internal Virion Protein [Raccoonpox virus]AOP31351.1 internal virion protein [Raccoonpox virus]